MSAATNANGSSEVTTWHASSADDVVKRLATDAAEGLEIFPLNPKREFSANIRGFRESEFPSNL